MTKKTSKQLAAEGMNQAADHADRLFPDPKWGEQALGFFRRYARDHAFFMTEDVRVWAYERGLPHDPSGGKAWGRVAINACKQEIVKASGRVAHTKHPPAHACKRDVWQSLIFKGVEVYA